MRVFVFALLLFSMLCVSKFDAFHFPIRKISEPETVVHPEPSNNQDLVEEEIGEEGPAIPDPSPPGPDLDIPASEGEIEQWLKFGKPQGFKILPPKKKKPLGPPITLSLSEAVTSTLQNQWNVKIAERGVDKQCGLAMAARGPFDPKFGGGYKTSWLLDTQVFGFKTGDNGAIDSASVFVEKLTRLGTRIALDAGVQKEHNPSFLFGNPFNRTNQTTVTFLLEQPLLRRFKYNQDSINEIVNDIEYEALQNELIQTMATNVRSTLFQYWDLVASEKVVNINKNAEKILEALASATERLVAGGRVAASELNEQFAELARNNKDIIAAQQGVFSSFNSLLFEMGINRCQFPLELPELKLEEFPAFIAEKCDWSLDHLFCLALQNRGDLLAAQNRIEETQWELRLASQNIYPNLDLRVGYDFFNSQINRRSKPFFSSTESHLAQRNYTVEVNLSVPLTNIEAWGEKKRRVEEEAQAYLAENRLQENILSEVTTTFRAQIELLDQIYYAQKSVEWYEKALKDELSRYKEGYGSLFIVIDFENRLRLTLVEQVRIQSEWAKNIVDLLFLTGALVQKDPCSSEIRVETADYQQLLRRKE